MVTSPFLQLYKGSGLENKKMVSLKGLYSVGCVTSTDQISLQSGSTQGCNVRKVNCSFVYSAYILKPVLSGRNL